MVIEDDNTQLCSTIRRLVCEGVYKGMLYWMKRQGVEVSKGR